MEVKSKIQNLCLALLFGTSLNISAAELVGDDLINYFSSTCRSQGDYTRQALGDAKSLIAILENIKNDQDCISISGGISQLRLLENKLTDIDNYDGLEIEVEVLKAQETELSLQLADITDLETRAEIKEAIREVQISKAGYVAEISASNNHEGRNVRSMYSDIILSTESAFNSISANHRCLQKNPEILPAITSMVGAVGGAATLVNPALGLGIAAATDFIGNTLESLKGRKFNRMIRNISDNSLALEGYKCVMESLSERWCSLEDAKTLLELKMSVIRESSRNSSLKSIFRLNDRDIPTLLEWLEKVRTGVPATSVADAERQKEVIIREGIVRAADATGNGVLAQSKTLYDLQTTEVGKYSVIKSVISSLTGTSCGSGGSSYGSPSGGTTNPLYDIYSNSYAPFYLLGLGSIPTRGDNQISFCSFEPTTDLPSGTYLPNYADIKNRYFRWIDLAYDRVNQEKAIVLQPDSLLVLSTAYEPSGKIIKLSVVDAITNLKAFLEKNIPEEFVSNSFRTIYLDTTKKLGEIKNIIKLGVEETIPAIEALELILKEAQLKDGIIVIQSRLELITRLSISEYLKSLSGTESEVAGQLLAADSFLETLESVKGDDYALISADIHKARPIAMGNMRNFMNLFSGNISSILWKNDKKIRFSNDPTLNEVYQRSSSELCLLLSSMPVWPRSVNKQFCVGTQLEAVIPGGPPSELITLKYLDKNFGERSCGYRNYLRKSKIYQEWNIKL